MLVEIPYTYKFEVCNFQDFRSQFICKVSFLKIDWQNIWLASIRE